MTVQPERLALAAEFPAASREQWQRLVEAVLLKSGRTGVSGQAAEDALTTTIEPGVRTLPLYTRADAPPQASGADAGYPGAAPYVRGSRAQATGWDLRQRHADPDPERTREAVLADLEHGVTSLWLAVGAPGALPLEALPRALDGVYLDLAGIALDAGPLFPEAAEQLLSLYAERGTAPAEATGNLGADAFGLLARTGDPSPLARQSALTAELALRCARDWPGLRAVVVDALPYQEAGASAAEELGTLLATGVAQLRALTDAGLQVDAAAGQLEFRLAADADQFLTIAKLRAARRLWARVARACGVCPAGSAMRQHAVTSRVMMAERDPWVNLLRTTVACTAAGVGGADAVTVLPFDDAVGLPDGFSRRIARNTQSILLEESHLGQVIDPAGGSWYVERLTDDLARAAWAWFQEIERCGGLARALTSGLVADRIGATWAARSERLARRREPVTGVSEFPNLAEEPLRREPVPQPLPHVTPPGPGSSAGLPRVRRSEAFEALRARSDAQLAALGKRPRLFLASLGAPAAHSARTSFAANLFQAGGIATSGVPDTAATTEPADLAREFAESGASVACLCGSDALYAEHAVPVAAALKAAGARYLLLAGRPAAGQEEALRAAGVDAFVFVGVDAVSVLSGLLDTIGVA